MNEETKPGGEAPPEADDAPQGPPPTPFQLLCGSMAAQVQMALGLLPDPTTQKRVLELGAARQGIEMLSMLQEKTQGNLDEEEDKTLNLLVTQLQMLFVEVVKKVEEVKKEQEEEKDEQKEE